MTALFTAPERMPGISAGVYARSDFEAIRGIIYREAGIVLAPGKEMLVYSRLAPLVRRSNSGTFAGYIELIEEDADERRQAVCALTTNHTFFFREKHHFEHLATQVRPGLVARARAKQPVRIWSAGCASGEETWSIVMTVLSSDRPQAQALLGSDTRILATDISTDALQRAERAHYPSASLEPVPAPLRALWTAERAGNAEMKAEPRQLVRFRALNLLGAWPFNRLFDVIFCRNVMIYFDQPTKERLVHRFAEQLAPGGTLYIGHSERVTGSASELLRHIGGTVYQTSVE